MIGARTWFDSDWRSPVSAHADGGDTAAAIRSCMILTASGVDDVTVLLLYATWYGTCRCRLSNSLPARWGRAEESGVDDEGSRGRGSAARCSRLNGNSSRVTHSQQNTETCELHPLEFGKAGPLPD